MNETSKKQPLFSIVVPAYNSESFINKCIESVLEQTYPDFELLLVDDGSKDSTLDICKAYAKSDCRVKVIHKENGGHTSARNAGLKLTEGKYILFLDSDDWIEDRTLEVCKNEISANDVDIVIYRLKSSLAADPLPVLVEAGCYEGAEEQQVLWRCLLRGADGKFVFPKSLSGKCFKREIIFDSQLSVPKEVLVGEDGAAFIGAMLKACSVSVVVNYERACYNYLERPGSISRSSDIHAFEKLQFLFAYYKKMLFGIQYDFSKQFDREIIAQLYTAALFIIRGGGGEKELNAGLDSLLKEPRVATALKKANFSLKGYKYLLKKYFLRYRLWRLVALLDRR